MKGSWGAIVVASVSGFLFGYDLGLTSGALLFIRDVFGLETVEVELFVASAKAGAIFGPFAGGLAMHRLGRKRALAMISIAFVIGPTMMAFSANLAVLVAGRTVVGFAIGYSAVVAPAHLAEISPPQIRGKVVAVYEVLLCVGMLVAPIVNFALRNSRHNWRLMVGVAAPIGFALASSICVLPESPRWLAQQGRVAEARLALQQSAFADVDAALGDLTAELESFRKRPKQSVCAQLCCGPERRAFYLVLGMAVINQACASTALINYTPTLLEQVGFFDSQHDYSILMAAVISMVKLVGVVIGMLLFDNRRFGGRRPILIGGSIAMAVCMSCLTVGLLLHSFAFVIASMMGFILAFAVSWAPGYWILVSEAFSMRTKPAASAVCTSVLFAAGAASNASFISLWRVMGAFSFLVFAGISLLGAVGLFVFLPETKGRSLTQAQALFAAAGASTSSQRKPCCYPSVFGFSQFDSSSGSEVEVAQSNAVVSKVVQRANVI